MRRAARVDRNQTEIVSALRAIGATVEHLHGVGQGCPDLCVGYRCVTVLLEVKDGSKSPSQRALTPAQLEWHGAWRGGPVAVVCDVESALRAVRAVGVAG